MSTIIEYEPVQGPQNRTILVDEVKVVTDPRRSHTGLWVFSVFLLFALIAALVVASIAYMNSTPKAPSASTFPHTIAKVFNFTGFCGETLLINGSYFKTGNQACINIPPFTCNCTVNATASVYGPLSAPLPAILAPKKIVSSVSGVRVIYGFDSAKTTFLTSDGVTDVISDAVMFVNQSATVLQLVLGTLVVSGDEIPTTCDNGGFIGPNHEYQLCFEVDATADARGNVLGSGLLLASAMIVATAAM